MRGGRLTRMHAKVHVSCGFGVSDLCTCFAHDLNTQADMSAL